MISDIRMDDKGDAISFIKKPSKSDVDRKETVNFHFGGL